MPPFRCVPPPLPSSCRSPTSRRGWRRRRERGHALVSFGQAPGRSCALTGHTGSRHYRRADTTCGAARTSIGHRHRPDLLPGRFGLAPRRRGVRSRRPHVGLFGQRADGGGVRQHRDARRDGDDQSLSSRHAAAWRRRCGSSRRRHPSWPVETERRQALSVTASEPSREHERRLRFRVAARWLRNRQ